MCYLYSEELTKKYKNRKYGWKLVAIRGGKPESPFEWFPFTEGYEYVAYPDSPDKREGWAVSHGVFHLYAHLREAKEEIRQLGARVNNERIEIRRVWIIEYHSAGIVPTDYFHEGSTSIGARRIVLEKHDYS